LIRLSRPGLAAGTRVTTVTTTAPSPFDFAGTAYSHGWAVLAPNCWDNERLGLTRTERLGPDRVVHLDVTGTRSASGKRVRVDVTHEGELRPAERNVIRRSIRRMFRLDEDMGPFYSKCRQAGPRWHPASRGLGRLLCSPTVFEDTVKTICTTNVQWGGTKAMVGGLVRHLGEPGPLTAQDWGEPGNAQPNSFPTPESIAAADGATLGTEEIRRSLLEIRGVGPDAAARLLMLLGRYDHLAVDTVYRAFVSERYFAGRRPSDREAEEVYAGWGRWKYLGYWFDLWQGLDERV
jgi:3-methyladenine DNA glycosylase/8-oxoguanine DNA glycosylase